MSRIDQLNEEQQNAIEELKKRTIHEFTPKMLEDPSVCYRFLKARNFNVKNAEIMLKKHILFRKEYNVDRILDDYTAPEVLRKYMPASFIGFDKEGSPIRFVTMEKNDLKGLFNSAKKIDILKYNLQMVEEDILACKQQSEKLGKLITSMVYINDYTGMTFLKATNREALEFMKLSTNIYQDNYPERIKSVYCINASIYFTMMFSAIKMIVAPALIEKMNVFGTEGWKEALLKIVDADVLPAFLGGNKTDPDGDPYCKSTIRFGGTVPEHYYLSKSKKTLHLEPGVKKLKVTRFSSTNITFDIEEPGSKLEWDFETKNKDIGFGLCYKDKNDSALVELVPKQRMDTGFEPEKGVYLCEKAGTYIMVFDNSYSWIHPKEIYYRTRILPPDKEPDQHDDSL